MANLKGGSFKKQSRDGEFRLYAKGVSRYDNPDSILTHSDETEKKRKMYFKDFVNYANELELSGKLNVHMGDYDLIKGFLLTRISHLCKISSLHYVSGISSLFNGLCQVNISIDNGGFDAIEDVRSFAHEMPEEDFRVGRAISNTKLVLNKLFDINFESAVLAQIQYETGFRISEAYKLAKNPEKYLFGNKIIGLIGKSNHVYEAKKISYDLIQKIYGVEKIPTAHTYSKHLKRATSNNESIPHDWRVTYVKEQFGKKIAKGMCREDALREVSREVNHHRIEITEYYLIRA